VLRSSGTGPGINTGCRIPNPRSSRKSYTLHEDPRRLRRTDPADLGESLPGTALVLFCRRPRLAGALTGRAPFGKRLVGSPMIHLSQAATQLARPETPSDMSGTSGELPMFVARLTLSRAKRAALGALLAAAGAAAVPALAWAQQAPETAITGQPAPPLATFADFATYAEKARLVAIVEVRDQAVV